MTASKVEIRPLKVHTDARGAVFEPLEPALLSGWRNVHTVISEPGAIRGNHRHLRGTEVTTVLRTRRWCAINATQRTEDVVVPAGAAWRFVFPPGTAHAFKNTGNRPFVLVSFNTEEHDPSSPDVERVELIA